jgi:hypothetical protein
VSSEIIIITSLTANAGRVRNKAAQPPRFCADAVAHGTTAAIERRQPDSDLGY